MWRTKLQIAIIEKNPQEISRLVSEMPEFESVDEMKAASALIKEALKLLHKLKDETGEALVKLKKHKDFLAATETKKVQRFDITS